MMIGYTNLFGVLGLASSRFSGDEERLIVLVLEHGLISRVRDREKMRRHLGS